VSPRSTSLKKENVATQNKERTSPLEKIIRNKKRKSCRKNRNPRDTPWDELNLEAENRREAAGKKKGKKLNEQTTGGKGGGKQKKRGHCNTQALTPAVLHRRSHAHNDSRSQTKHKAGTETREKGKNRWRLSHCLGRKTKEQREKKVQTSTGEKKFLPKRRPGDGSCRSGGQNKAKPEENDLIGEEN